MTVLKINTELEIVCDECGCELEIEMDEDYQDRTKKILIQVCPQCLEKAKKESYDEGYEDRSNEI